MTDLKTIQGVLQSQIMPVLWRLGGGTVEQIRLALPRRYRSAYTTVQTVLNRLTERGLLDREMQGNAFVYKPVVSEAEYLSRSIDQALSSASTEARQTVLAELVGGLGRRELAELRQLAKRVQDKRSTGRP